MRSEEKPTAVHEKKTYSSTSEAQASEMSLGHFELFCFKTFPLYFSLGDVAATW